MISLEKWKILTPLQKLPINEGDLGKIIVATGFEWLPKGQKIAQSGHTAPYLPIYNYITHSIILGLDTSASILFKLGKPSSKVTFVGVHDRRTDYLEFRKRTLMTEDLDEEYIPDAMEYFREEYGDSSEVVFVYTSDDMKWGQGLML